MLMKQKLAGIIILLVLSFMTVFLQLLENSAEYWHNMFKQSCVSFFDIFLAEKIDLTKPKLLLGNVQKLLLAKVSQVQKREKERT